MSNILKRLLIFSLSLALFACVSPPRQETKAQFIDARKIRAQQLEQNNDFPRALNQWQIVVAVEPSNQQALSAIDRLQSKINTRAKRYFSTGLSAFNRGNTRQAETYFLKTLASNPHHQQAFSYLNKITTQRMQNAQKAKNRAALKTKKQPSADGRVNFKQLEALFKRGKYTSIDKLSRQLSTNEMDSRILALLYETDFLLAQQYIQNNDPGRATAHFDQMQLRATNTPEHSARVTTLKRKLADSYYAQARTFLNSDLNRTIKGLEQALYYQPKHTQARILLVQTQRMQDNLNRIKQLQK